jgi:glutamine amidotransferase
VSGRVVVVDYGAGNLHSVARALRHEGADLVGRRRDDEVASADRLVLPGVGAFADAMRELDSRGLVEPVKRFFETGRPFLGICVGMQMLLTESTEFGLHPGLGLVPGRVVRLSSERAKVPHVGWNAIFPARKDAWKGTCLEVLEGHDRPMVYFVHSFNAEPVDETHRLADASHGDQRVCAAVRRDNAVGLQFHPEMSGSVGLSILRSFLSSKG